MPTNAKQINIIEKNLYLNSSSSNGISIEYASIPKKKQHIKAVGKATIILTGGEIWILKSSKRPIKKSGIEQNNIILRNSQLSLVDSKLTERREAYIAIPPNLEIDFVWRVCGISLKFLYPKRTNNLFRNIKAVPISKDKGKISVIKKYYTFKSIKKLEVKANSKNKDFYVN